MTSPVALAQIAALLDERDREFDPPPFDARAVAPLGAAGGEGTPHRRLLELANGAYLFDRALHLFGACDGPPWHSLAQWNSPSLWRDAYGAVADGLTFFAEDAFGDQYAYNGQGGEVVVFEAELGRVAPAAPSFTAWLDALLADPRAVLPIELLERERAQGRRLEPGMQFFAYPPLFSVEAEQGVQVGHVDAVEAMRFRGGLAVQVRDLAPGTQVKIEVE
jgi:hypothetical protein